jgi:gas vesicle protein
VVSSNGWLQILILKNINKMENFNNKGRVVVGSLLIGALVGATVGVLFAPHKGKKTRKNIAKSVNKTAKNFKNEITNEGQYLKEKASDFGNLIEGKISSAATSFKDKANELLHNGSDHQMNK